MNYKKIEKKWQDFWEEKEVFKAIDFDPKPPYYILVEFPYPSGAGLHVGHVRSYTAQDAIARLKRMQGYNVLFPMGWDAFGAPAERYAIRNHIHPKPPIQIITNGLNGNFYNFINRVWPIKIPFPSTGVQYVKASYPMKMPLEVFVSNVEQE